MALKHKVAFQPLIDYLMKHCSHSLFKTLCYAEKTIFFSLSLSVSFIFWTTSATTLVFEFVCNPKLDNDTRLLAALFLLSVLSSPLCLPLLGKVPFTLWHWLRTIGQIPWAIFCCFPRSGKPLSVLAIFGADCKLWMIDEVFLLQKETSGTLGATRWLRRCACVHVFGLSGCLCLLRFLFYNLTSFIFSGCGITIGYCSLSLTQMGDKDSVCHGRAECVTSYRGKIFLSQLWTVL